MPPTMLLRRVFTTTQRLRVDPNPQIGKLTPERSNEKVPQKIDQAKKVVVPTHAITTSPPPGLLQDLVVVRRNHGLVTVSESLSFTFFGIAGPVPSYWIKSFSDQTETFLAMSIACTWSA